MSALKTSRPIAATGRRADATAATAANAGRTNRPAEAPILDALGQSPGPEQPAVAKPGTTSAAGHDPPELRPSSGDDDPGEDGQAAASDANDASDAQ